MRRAAALAAPGPPTARYGAHLPRMSVRRWLAAVCCALTFVACAGPSAEAQGGAPPVPPPSGAPPPPPGSGLPDGQWVYTQQYGWIWMPYDDQYSYVPPGGTGEPLEFVFLGSYGWNWIAAPWVWGYGPSPYYGRPGPHRFAWYQHGFWREPHRWHYTAPPERGEVARRGVRPAPQRSGPRPPAQGAQPAQPAPPERHGEGGDRGGGGEHGGGGHDGGGFEPHGREGH